LIHEEGAKPQKPKREKIYKPMTPFVQNKVWGTDDKYKPTKRQLEAIDIALNTPDIALIQGPPGTGKTTVIVAILERLNEEYDKKKSVRGKILVTGFQHDAVENIVSRLSVNSLPAVKFGRRPGENEEDDTTTNRKIEKWAEDIRKKLRDKHPQLHPIKEQRELQILSNQYARSHSVSVIGKILELIISLPGAYISADIVSQAKTMLRSMKDEPVQGDRSLLAAIRALRTTPDDFADDGARNAMMVYVSLRERLPPKEAELLKKAGHWKPGAPANFLKELEELKTALLDRYTPRPVFNIEKPRKEVLSLIANVNEALSRQRGRGSLKDEILAGFLNELETNPEGIKSAVEDYCFVYAATTQGAEGKAIRRVKTKDPNDYVTYDTVIIDEAARVNPRDLLIPMAQAEKTIILVGDHRQLPHIYEEEIIRKAMETKAGSGDTQTPDTEKETIPDQFENYIKHSMFEYLKNRLEKLYADDGIKRTCTLDEQYRTHPLLGNLVNKHFYAKHSNANSDESFESPRPESDFRQNLPGLDGRPALWINVPGIKGHEKRSGRSWTRREEAMVIVHQLKKWLDCEEGRNLTFGVISFYRAQSNIILEEAGKLGITGCGSPGEPWEIKKEYRYLTREADGKEEERLRIGTVDAFQGMEFDVVFLSMVRSLRITSNRGEEADYERLKANTFGRLVSENLLCVSMSRQKKVLVVVGDAALVQSGIGRDAVPALADFCDKCRTEGKYHDS
jgi:DNA polymerase III delta prime subunit